MGDDINFQQFFDSLVHGICKGLNVPVEMVKHDTGKYIDEFDAMTDLGFKLNLITGRYEKEN